MGKKKRKKDRRPVWEREPSSRRVTDAALMEQDVFREAQLRGMRLRSNPVCGGDGRQIAWHWMFDDETTGQRLLDYWPTSGKWDCRRLRLRGTCPDPLQVVEVASMVAGQIEDAEENS